LKGWAIIGNKLRQIRSIADVITSFAATRNAAPRRATESAIIDHRKRWRARIVGIG
jgi:hypothetical protein